MVDANSRTALLAANVDSTADDLFIEDDDVATTKKISPAALVSGALKDTALIAALDLGGFTITNVGDIDGRDVSADGTALDAVVASEANAIHDNVAGEILAVTLKATPTAADMVLIEDAAAGNVKKRAAWPTGLADADAIHDNVAAEISVLTLKATPTAADHVLIEDAAAGNAKKRAAWPTAGGGDVTAALNMTDNFLIRGDGGAKGVQDATAASLDDSDNLSALNSVQVAVGSVGAVGVRVGSATIGLFRPAANQLGLGANSEAVIVDNDNTVPSLRPDVTATWALGEEAFAWSDVNANAFSLINAGSVDYTLNANGWQYVGGLGTLLIGQITPSAGTTATAFQVLGGQGGAASGAAGRPGGATAVVGGIGGNGDATYAPGIGGTLSLTGGAAGTEVVESVVSGGDVDIDPGAGTGVTENGNIALGMTTTPVLIESGAAPWDHGGKFTFVPDQDTETTASRTLVIDDDGSEIYCSHASNINITLDTITGGAGVRVKLIPTHATGTITIVAGTATVRKQASFTLVSAEQYAAIYVYFKGDSEAYIEGGLALA